MALIKYILTSFFHFLRPFSSILVQPIRNKAAKSEGFLVICLGSLVFIIFLGENG